MLENSENINLDASKTALIIACEQGDYDEVLKLISAGADLEQPDTLTQAMRQETSEWDPLPTGAPPLHWAVAHPKIVELLLKQGAKADSTDSQDTSATLACCTSMANRESLFLVLKQNPKNINQENVNGLTPALLAVIRDDFMALVVLNQFNYPNINELIPVSDKNTTSLCIQAALYLHQSPERDYRTVAFFLNNGASLCERDSYGNTLVSITLATAAEDNPPIKHYIEVVFSKCCYEIKDKISRELPAELIGKKLTPQAIDKIRQTFINNMLEWNYRYINQYSDDDQVIYQKLTELVIAEVNSQIDQVLKLIAEKQAALIGISNIQLHDYKKRKQPPSLSEGLAKFMRESCKIPVHKGFESYNDRGQTPLMIAAGYGIMPYCHELLLAKVNVNQIDNSEKGCTALHYAAAKGQDDVVKLLLKHDADLELVCNKGATPLFYAVADEHYSTSKLLLEAGSDPNSETCSLPPLYYALYTLQADIANLLVTKGADVYFKIGDSTIVDAVLGSLALTEKFPEAVENVFSNIHYSEAHADLLFELLQHYANYILDNFPQHMDKKDKVHFLISKLEGLSDNPVHQVKLHAIGSQTWNAYLRKIAMPRL